MSTISSLSHEGFFSSDSSDTEEEENTSIKSVNDLKDYDEDEELNKIIAKIEREHISKMYDKHLYNQKDNKKATRGLCPYIKIKKERRSWH